MPRNKTAVRSRKPAVQSAVPVLTAEQITALASVLGLKVPQSAKPAETLPQSIKVTLPQGLMFTLDDQHKGKARYTGTVQHNGYTFSVKAYKA